MEEQEKKEEISITKDKKNIIIFTSVLVVIILAILIFCTIFALINNGNTKIIQGVKIQNIDVSNLTKDEALNKINEIVEKKKTSKIKIKKEDFENEISIEQLEPTYNIEECINKAFNIGRSGNIINNNFEIISSKIKGKEIDLQNNYNKDVLSQIIEEANGQIPGAMKDNSYYIEENELIVTKGTAGNAINKEELEKKINSNLEYIDKLEETIEIPVKQVIPEEIDIEKIYSEIHTEAKDAYYTKDPFTIHPHVTGVDFAISMEEAKKILEEDKAEYIIPLKITEPNITTDKLGSEAFPDLLASYSTKYDGGNINRTTNLNLASRKINGTVIMPGETFSYNAIVGERTIAAGYKDAKIYVNGKVVDGLAGGICQISSTLYNTALLANLDIVSRKNHGLMPSYVSAGRDATVVYGATDFKFKNSRKYPIKIVSSVRNGIAKIDIYGVKEETEYKVEIQSSVTETLPFNTSYIEDENLEEGKEIIEQKGTNGCRSVAYRVLYLNGGVVSKKLLSNDTYKPIERVIRKGTKKQETQIKTEQKEEQKEDKKENNKTENKDTNTETSKNTIKNNTTKNNTTENKNTQANTNNIVKK